ncbi:AAA family ATPase [Micromonospora sp. KLBMP9576]|uniref:AAA family ATPase n=1 Tax=Micromonospora sp. KLBMP9576 TaxID=3424769 RepID=UPI003D921DB7
MDLRDRMRRRTTFSGRRAELAALHDAQCDTAERGRLVLVRGPAGIGKSALLEAAARSWRRAGVQVIRASGVGAGDPYGFRCLADAVRDRFEEIGEPRLAGPLGALGQAPGGPGAATRLVLELGAAFDLVCRTGPAVLLLDDLDDLAAPALAAGAAARPGCLVVATCRDGSHPAALQLAARADLVVDLPPLPDDAVEAMLTRVCGAPPDGAVLPALRAALGPLSGDPGTLLSTMADLERAGRLTVLGGNLCLTGAGTPIALPAGHPLVGRARALGAPGLFLATAVAVAPLAVEDLSVLAEATRDRLDDYGRAADRLVESGVLVVDDAGRLHPRCAALAARIVEDAGPGGTTRLHRALAAALLRRVGLGGAVDSVALADHLSLAGRAMPPDPRHAAWLAAMAERRTPDAEGAATTTSPSGAAEALGRSEAAGPERTIRWLRAALWHAGAGPERERIGARLLRLLVRAGRYGELAEAVASVPPDRAAPPEFAVVGAFAAIHTGVPAPGSDSADPYAWWFGEAHPPAAHCGRRTAGDPLLDPTELAAVRWSVRGGPGRPAGPLDDALLAAGSVGDLVTAFELVLGPRYGPPARGPLAAYRRLVDSFAAGDLPAVLSAAREVEVEVVLPAAAGGADRPDGVLPDLARLFAAEAHALLGDTRRAAAALAAVPVRPATRALRAWVACGLADRPGGDVRGALRDGGRAFDRLPDGSGRIGVEQLLPRLAGLAVRAGDTVLAGRLLTGAESLRSRAEPWITRETSLLVRALVRRDPVAARAGVALTRERGHRPALVETYLAIGAVVAEPQPWLRQAYEACGAVPAPFLRSRVAALMRERGLPVPRARPPHRTGIPPVEQRVIELIRDGRTNRQISVALRVSEKTVENHLTRLFARTGCRSRVELAAASLSGQPLAGTPTGTSPAGAAPFTPAGLGMAS